MLGRNDPCPCGSGKKFKKCCGSKVQQSVATSQAADLPGAIACFENGNYAMAASMAKAFLNQYPKEPVAWQVLGVSLYFLGDLSGAENAFRNLIKLDNKNPDALNNLGLVLFEQGQFELAEDFCEQALKINPSMAGAYNNLGNIHHKQGKLESSLLNYQTAVKFGMRTAEIYCNLGTVLYEQADTHAAEKAFVEAIKLEPNSVPALSNLGAILLQRNQFEDALSKLKTAYEIDPTDIDVLCNLARYWHEMNNHEKTENFYLLALKLEPDNPTLNYRIGVYYHSLMQHELAKNYFLKSVKTSPSHIQALTMLGEIALAQDNYVEAEYYFNKALENGGERNLDFVKGYSEYLLFKQRHQEARGLWNSLVSENQYNKNIMFALANYYKHAGEFEKADLIYKEMSSKEKSDRKLLTEWAVLEETRHNLDRAHQLIKMALDLDTENAGTKLLLAQILDRKKLYRDALDALNSIPKAAIDNDIYLASRYFYQRTNVLDHLGEYDSAFADLTRANEIRKRKFIKCYDYTEDKESFAREIHFFSKHNLKQLPVYSEDIEELRPVFIVGFPRSGTSLLEQILSSHSMIAAGGELPFIEEMKGKINDLTGGILDYPECMLDEDKPLHDHHIRLLHDYYIESVRDIMDIQSQEKFVTDKMPHNLANLVLICLVFPKSPIIHITRHPMDACLSALMADFSHGHTYTSSFENTAKHYMLLMQSTEYYKSVLNMKYLQIRYEDIIEEPRAIVGKVLDFIGVDWEDKCLEFHKSKRVVKTASHAQVTEKIYTSSRYRYKNYYKHLEPYEPILHEAIETLGYTFEA